MHPSIDALILIVGIQTSSNFRTPSPQVGVEFTPSYAPSQPRKMVASPTLHIPSISYSTRPTTFMLVSARPVSLPVL